MVRCQDDIAIHGFFCQDIVQSGRIQVARQQDRLARVIDPQHNAVCVVAADDAAPGRMQHFDIRRCLDVQAISCAYLAKGNASVFNRHAQRRESLALFLEHDW